MSFGKFGLLKGLGQGVAQAGDTLMKDKLDQMKEERLQAFQQKIQQQQFDRDDKLRGEDRQFAEETQARNLAFQSQAQVQGQQNWESEFGLRKDQFEQGSDLVKKQLEQMDQQIKITGMELGQVEARESLRQNILSETDPSRKQQLMGDYASMMSDFTDKPLTITAYGEMDEVSGQQTRTTMQWDAGSRRWVPVMAGSAQPERPSLEELIEAPAADGQSAGAPGSEGNPMPYQQGGLLRQPSSSELSQELGVGVNPRLSEQIGNVASMPGRAIDAVIQGSAPAYTQWVKGMIEKDKVDQVSFLNRHAYQAALDSGQLNEREASIVRRLLGEQ